MCAFSVSPRREMFSCLLVVLLIKSTEKFLEESSHLVIGDRRQWKSVGVIGGPVGEVDVRVGDALDDREQTLVVGKFLRLVVVVEVLQHVFHIIAESVEIFHKVVIQDALIVSSL